MKISSAFLGLSILFAAFAAGMAWQRSKAKEVKEPPYKDWAVIELMKNQGITSFGVDINPTEQLAWKQMDDGTWIPSLTKPQ